MKNVSDLICNQLQNEGYQCGMAQVAIYSFVCFDSQKWIWIGFRFVTLIKWILISAKGLHT